MRPAPGYDFTVAIGSSFFADPSLDFDPADFSGRSSAGQKRPRGVQLAAAVIDDE